MTPVTNPVQSVSPADPDPVVPAPLPQELEDLHRELGLNAPRSEEPHSGEGMASIMRRLQWA